MTKKMDERIAASLLHAVCQEMEGAYPSRLFMRVYKSVFQPVGTFKPANTIEGLFGRGNTGEQL